MKLYYAPAACSLAVHIAMRELNLSFDLVKVDLSHHTLADGSDYYAIVSRGYVPAVELDDGSVHTEVAALLQLLGDLEPSQDLMGTLGSARRTAIAEWLTFTSTELHKQFSPWLWHKDTADSTRTHVLATLATRFADIERQLDGKEWIAGEFSVADCYLFTILHWTKLLRLPMTDHPGILAYLARMAARPAVAMAIQAEREAK
ncbi:glutathione transferase GstA [soil metagenome]